MRARIKVFVGSDRSQLLPAKILKFSILENTKNRLDFKILDKIKIPQPKDLRQSQRTGFSFCRWAIPEICKFKGKAIYLDADMLVFRDIEELWNLNLSKSVIAVSDKSKDFYMVKKYKSNKNESSVMLINCEKADWTISKLIKGLDGSYTYSQMMSDLCFLKENKISRIIPGYWNSLDFWNKKVALLHFTQTTTQPWVSLENKFGFVWVDFLKKLINQNKITFKEVKKEVDLGFFRPSILKEINCDTCKIPNSKYAEELKKIDVQKKFIPHKKINIWNEKRERAIFHYELDLLKKKSFITFLNFLIMDKIKGYKKKIKEYIHALR